MPSYPTLAILSALLLVPAGAWGAQTAALTDAALSSGEVAFDPSTHKPGSLPTPIPTPGPSNVPESALFYVLPFLGLWLILRRRHRRVGH